MLDKIVAAAEAEANDDSGLREQLLEAQMRLELGEISDKEFRNVERDILARLRAIKGDRTVTILSAKKITGIEATVADELNK